jgi:hypothetical protein
MEWNMFWLSGGAKNEMRNVLKTTRLGQEVLDKFLLTVWQGQ